MFKDKYQQYTTVAWSGKELLKKYSLTENGIWEVNSEDGPYLGMFEGTLDDVIKIAVTLPQFLDLGTGGAIRKISPIKVDSTTAVRANEIRSEIATMKEAINKLVDELAALGVKV